jgi:hypothetical protein
MTIYYNASKDSLKPASLALKDRVDDKDVIHLTECLWCLTDTKISIIGLLGDRSIGLEDYNDKNFKPNGQKVVFSFLRDENSVYDRDAKKTTIEPATAEQKVQFQILHTALSKLQTEQKAVCASAVLKPKVSALVAGAAEGTDEEAKNCFRFATKEMFVFTPREPEKLTGEDTDLINTLVNQKPGDFKKSGGNGTYVPKETETERLAARWQFIQSHFEGEIGVKAGSLPQLMMIIGAQPETEQTVYKAALNMLVQLISK